MPQLTFSQTFQDWDHPRAGELAGWPIECWPADALQTVHVTATWERCEDCDDAGTAIVGLQIDAQPTDGRELLDGIMAVLQVVVTDRIYGELEDAARLARELRTQAADRKRSAREIERAHMLRVHSDGSKCPDGCGRSAQAPERRDDE